jgi:hypothetical protein
MEAKDFREFLDREVYQGEKYREFIIALVMWERDLDYEDAEIIYYEWYESSEGSFLSDILSGERLLIDSFEEGE